MRAAAKTTFSTNTDTNHLPTRDFRTTTGIIDHASTRTWYSQLPTQRHQCRRDRAGDC